SFGGMLARSVRRCHDTRHARVEDGLRVTCELHDGLPSSAGGRREGGLDAPVVGCSPPAVSRLPYATSPRPHVIRTGCRGSVRALAPCSFAVGTGMWPACRASMRRCRCQWSSVRSALVHTAAGLVATFISTLLSDQHARDGHVYRGGLHRGDTP